MAASTASVRYHSAAGPQEMVRQLAALHSIPRAHWSAADYACAADLLVSIRGLSNPPAALQLPEKAWRQLGSGNTPPKLVAVFIQRLAAQCREASPRPARQRAGLARHFTSVWRAGRVWAGQRLLRSRLHSAYLKLIRAAPGYIGPSIRPYQQWLAREQELTPLPGVLRERAAGLRLQPKISLLLAVHDPRLEWLRETVESVRVQAYKNWELCICDDASKDPQIAEYLKGAAQSDARIRLSLSQRHAGVSATLNSAARMASGDYVASIDHDDVLPYWSLFVVAEGLQDPAADVLYTDEDFMDEAGVRRAPHFKPGWSPTLLSSCMYFGHLVVIRRDLFEGLGGYRTSFDGAQDYDLALRATERSRLTVHIPKVAYHWRMHSDSVAGDRGNKPYTHTVGLEALRSAAGRRNWRGATVSDGEVPNLFFVNWSGLRPGDIDIVLASKGGPAPGNYARLTAGLARQGFNVYGVGQADGNTGSHANRAAKEGKGAHIIFLNPELAPVSDDWCRRLVQGHKEGITGARIVTPDGLIHHAGFAMGVDGSVGSVGRSTPGSPHWLWLNAPREVSAIDFGCFAVGRELFDRLQGFDETMPPCYQAPDFCLRASELGYSTVIEPRAVLRIPAPDSLSFPTANEWQIFLTRWMRRICEPDPHFSRNVVSSDDGLRL